MRSLHNVRTVRLGFDVESVLYVYPAWRGYAISAANLSGATLSPADRIALSHQLLDEAHTIPGVSSAALILSVPFYATFAEDLFTMHRDTVPLAGRFALQAVSAEYFRTVGTRVVRGRAFTDADRTGSARVMIVSEAMARTLWPGQDAIGQCLRISADTMPCSTVIGVTENIKQSSLSNDPGLQFYLPIGQYAPEMASLFVRIDGDASRAAEAVRRRLQRLMPGATFVTVTPMRDILDPEVRSWQLGATMFVAFGALALILAAIGLYSVIAYGVAQRTRELGVRRALGARIGNVVWLVLGDGLRFTILGLVFGSAIALVAGRWVQPLLFEERPWDPLVFAAVTGVLFVAAVAASIVPALHASRVDPNIALRAD